VFAGRLSLSVGELEPIPAPFRAHAHDEGVKFEQFADNETAPPALLEGLWLMPMEQLGEPVVVPPITQVICVPDTDTLVQPLRLKVTSARARDVYVAAATSIVSPTQNANRGRARTDGFDGFISTPYTPLGAISYQRGSAQCNISATPQAVPIRLEN